MRTLTLLAATILVLAFSLPARAQAPATQPTTNPNLPTIWIVGDSTASNGADLGWGSHLPKYFDPTKVNVVNRARGGRSSRTFTSEGLWQQVKDQLKIDDIVLIQFGHNDGGPVDAAPFRGSFPGLGNETKEVTRDEKTETVRTYGWYLRRMVLETMGKSSMPILLSLTVRNEWPNGKVERGSGSGRFGKWTEDIADEQGAFFVDLTNIVADEYEKMGREKVATFFPIDHTHTSAEGADFNAAMVVAGLKGLPNHPVDTFLSEKGKTVQPNTKYLPK